MLVLPTRRLGIAGMSALAIVLCDLLHELGHLAATRLPLGVKAQSISTIGLTTDGSSTVVAAAGSAVNAMAGILLLPPLLGCADIREESLRIGWAWVAAGAVAVAVFIGVFGPGLVL